MFKGILTFISYALRSIILVTIDTFCVYRMHCKLLNWGTIKIQGIQMLLPTLDSRINIGVRLLTFEKFWREKKNENDRNA